jgi:hypothetical protein
MRKRTCPSRSGGPRADEAWSTIPTHLLSDEGGPCHACCMSALLERVVEDLRGLLAWSGSGKVTIEQRTRVIEQSMPATRVRVSRFSREDRDKSEDAPPSGGNRCAAVRLSGGVFGHCVLHWNRGRTRGGTFCTLDRARRAHYKRERRTRPRPRQLAVRGTWVGAGRSPLRAGGIRRLALPNSPQRIRAARQARAIVEYADVVVQPVRSINSWMPIVPSTHCSTARMMPGVR